MTVTQEPAGDTAHFRIRSDPSELASVRQRVRQQAQAVGFADDEIGRIMLAVDEALANVIRHGYGGRCEEPIDVRIEQVRAQGDEAIRVTIRDFGRQIDPPVICGRCLEDVRPGGLGVHIMRAVMDEVTYAPAEGGGMQLVMKKKKKAQ